MAGRLYLVATPIGNLGDLSPRAVETLAQADFIAAEDTRVSMKLLNHFDIKKPLVSYHEHNRASAGQAILERLLGGEVCALVTDAGTPAISDPGQELVALCGGNGVEVQAIPGCCAAIAALAVSGLDTRRFTFEGFLPAGKQERRAALAGIIAMKPKYLVLDEPMAGLDPLGRKAILDTIDNLRASLGCAVLMVSHSMDDMADRAERVAVMNGGRLIMEGKTRDVFAQSELLTSIGLDVPQVSKLGMELRKRGIDIPENIYEIEEMELALLKLLSKGGRA